MNNLTSDKKVVHGVHFRECQIGEYAKKLCSEQRSTLPESNSRNNIILTILHDFSSEEVHFQERAIQIMNILENNMDGYI